ncbi:peptidase T [bacterium]|nr:peptidase T [bacterium]
MKNEVTEVFSLINEARLINDFVEMAKVDTGSCEEIAESGKIPSTEKQVGFADNLALKLKQMGLRDVSVDKHSIVTATFDGNIDENSPIIGLLAHMDTSPSVPTGVVLPQIRDYNGGGIKLAGDVVIAEKDLTNYIGQKVITASGETLLGADDKAGIAEIIEALNIFIENPQLKHPTVKIAFTPDEETGCGISKFDIKAFGADVAYTVDGDVPSVIEDESFNAFNPEIIINGQNVHTGYAKGKMINAISVASWLINELPKDEVPEKTEGRQGFFHVDGISGDVSSVKINMLVRDHDFKKALDKIEFLESVIEKAEKKFGCKIEFNRKEKYRNMKVELDKFPAVVEFAKEGVKRSGFEPKTVAIRGGTDGSQLSLQGLLTPNLGAGGHNFHSKTEFLPVEEMKKCAENIVNILIVWAEKANEVMPKIVERR